MKYAIINPFPYTHDNDDKALTGDDDWATVGGAGAAAWGSITGTLANQTDVQAALDAKEASGTAAAAVAAHEAEGDPHAQYLTPAEGDAAYDSLNAASIAVAAHEAASDPHPTYLTATEGNAAYQPLDSDLTTIASTITAAGLAILDDADATAQRATLGAQSVAAKDAANGYPGLSASSLVNPAQLGTGSSITTKYLRGDSTWQTLAGGGDLLSTNNLSDVTNAATARSNLGAAPLASPVFTGTVTLPSIAAGSASASSWPKFTAGTVLTTAEAGAIELDANCFYLTTDAGNRGVVPVEHIIRADATRTFTSDTNQQAIFNSPAGGTLTLETGVYFFEALIAMTSMSGTSGNGKFSLLGAGGATLGAILWQAYGGDVASEGTAAAIGGSWHVIATQTAANIVTAATGTALCFELRGTFEVTGAGTIIPSFAQTTAAAAVVSIGSYFKCRRVGSTSMASVGQWS